ncbi:MAG: hypothetical protein AAF456_06135 [Planctomycetota bacterium]
MSQDPGQFRPPNDPSQPTGKPVDPRTPGQSPAGFKQPAFLKPGEQHAWNPSGQQVPQHDFNRGPSGPSTLLIAGLIFGVLGLMAVGLIAAVFIFTRSLPPGAQPADPQADQIAGNNGFEEPEPDKFQKASNTFSGSPLEYHADLESITGFFFELSTVADQSGSEDFKSLFDAAKYVREMRDSGFISGLARLTSNSELMEVTTSRVLGPVSFDEFTIYKIEQVAGYPSERLIYVVTSDDDFYCMPQRFWLTPENGSWLIYDWEPLDYGVRDSYETAVLIGSTDRESGAYSDYVDISNNFDQAMLEAAESFDFARNESRLRRIERLPYPPYLRNELLLDIAHRWEELGDLEGERQCLLSAQNADRTPGILLELAANEMDYGNYEQALAYFQRYENAVGPMLKSREQTASCYQLLHDTANEVKTRLDIMERFPDTPAGDHVSRVVVNGTDAEVRQAFEFADNCFDPESLYYELISNFENSFGIDTYIKKVSDHLDRTASELDATRTARLALFETQGRLDEALALLTAPLKIDRYDDAAAYELFYFAADNDLMDRVSGIVDSQVAFAQLDQLYNDDFIDGKILNDFAMKFLAEEPDDPTANYYAGLSFSGREMFAEAIPYLEAAARDYEEDGIDDSGVSEYAVRVLARSRYMTMEINDVVEIYQDDEDRLDYLSYYMIGRNDFEGMQAILDISEVDFENRLLLDAVLAYGDGELDVAQEYLEELIADDTFDPEEYSYATFEFRSLLMKIAESNGNMSDALRTMPTDFMAYGIQSELASRGDEQGLINLANVIASLKSKSLSVNEYAFEVQRLFDNEAYEEVISYAEANRLDQMPIAGSYDLDSTPFPMIVRAVVRAGRLDSKRKLVNRLASRADSELGDNSLLLLLAVLREDESNFKRLIASSYESSPFLGDPDVDANLLSEARHEQYSLYPSSIPVFRTGDEYRLQILLSGDPGYDSATIKSLLESGGFQGIEVSQLEDQATNTSAWLAESDNFSVALAVRPRHPFDPDSLSRAVNDDQVATNEHTHQLHIHVVYDPFQGETAEETAFNIAAALENEKYMAIYDNVDSMAWPRVKAVMEQRVSRFGPESLTTWMHLDNYSEAEIETEQFEYQRAREFVKELMTALESYNADPGSSDLTIGVVGWRGEAREVIPVKVESVHTNMYGLPVFGGEVTRDSRLFPAVLEDLPVEASIWTIRSFDLESGGETQSASYIGNDS